MDAHHWVGRTVAAVGLFESLDVAPDGSSSTSGSSTSGQQTVLSVGLYNYVPQAAFAALKLKTAFEDAHPNTILNVSLHDSYTGNTDIGDFDLVELDWGTVDAGVLSQLHPFDAGVVPPSNDFVGPSRILVEEMMQNGTMIAYPHLNCGNFLVWSSSEHPGLPPLPTFAQVQEVLEQSDTYLSLDLYGSDTLGAYYADSYIDSYGINATQTHLLALATGAEQPDNATVYSVVDLRQYMAPLESQWLAWYHDVSDVYPAAFGGQRQTLYVGYSETTFWSSETRTRSVPGATGPYLEPYNTSVAQLPYVLNQSSNGHVGFVDAFVQPRVSGDPSVQAAINNFLKFAASPEGFAPFVKPLDYGSGVCLLPAVGSLYGASVVQSACGIIDSFRSAIDPVLLTDSANSAGMRVAGNQIKSILNM